MLTPIEQDVVASALATRLAVVGVRPFATAAFPPFDIDFLRVLPTDLTTADQHASFVVGYCLDSRWTNTPSLLEQTLTALITAGIEVATLVPLRTRVQQRIDPMPSPSQTLWLDADMPFFSRAGLRPLINNLLTADAQPILQIVGPSQSGEECGKSYTRELLDHVGPLTRRDVHTVFVDIPKGTGPSFCVEELAEALVAPTLKDIASRPPRSGSNYPRMLCRWVLNAAVTTGGKWIYVLDGFNQADLQAETRALVHALALEIAGGEYRRRIRLVLIDYPLALPSIQPAKILRDDVPAATTVTESDIIACLSAHYEDLFKRKAVPQPDIQELRTVAQSLLAAAPAGPPKRLETLNMTLRKLRQDDLSAP